VRRLTVAQARRAALAAQGLAAPRPATPNIGHLSRVIRTIGVLQIDSVNVVQRAHHLTVFSRLGAFDTDLLWRALDERRIFEYWGRMASFCPIEDYPLYRWRMDRHEEVSWRRVQMLQEKAPGYIDDVYRQVEKRGPLAPSELDDPGERGGPWWGWADGKVALEYLFATGRVTVSHRDNFARYYDVVERVIPEEHHQAEVPEPREAQRQLLVEAARSQALGTARDLIDYYWIRPPLGRELLAELVAEGALTEVEVEGWRDPVFMHPEARVPRAVDVRRLINPFDTHAFNRDRLERLHGFPYRIEIYVPKPKRVYGYYVFPFLLGDDLVARVDLKADRKRGVLTVPGAFLEEGEDASRVAGELALELGEMARWLGLGDIEVGRKGNLARHVRAAL
jgi:uncharacterized protein YcaQ